MMAIDHRTNEQLLGATEREPAAFGVFFERNAPRVLTFFRRRTGDPETAADLMAETFAAAMLAAPRYRPTESAVSWLFAIARNKLIDSRRRGRVEDEARRRLALEPLELDDDDLAEIEALASSDDTGAEAVRLVATLPPDQRAAVEARILDEREYPEIASDLGCSEAVVRKRVSRGLNTLRLGMENPS
jgi:RNA polymerase sigma factor (sigma-70 family)